MDKKSFLDTILQKRYRQKHFFRIMKISTFLLFVFILCANAENSNSQNINVTIRSNQTQLERVLNEVERQTGFLFVYNNHVDVNRKVSVHLKKASLQETLKDLFKGTDVKYTIDGSYILLSINKTPTKSTSSSNVSQQKHRITGVVKDEKGDPIIGASITIKGTSHGAMTNLQGVFTLEAPVGAIIQVSYIGYQNKVFQVGNETNYRVVLTETSKILSEVVVTALGITREKKGLGYATQEIKAGELENRNSNLVSMLSGKVAEGC